MMMTYLWTHLPHTLARALTLTITLTNTSSSMLSNSHSITITFTLSIYSIKVSGPNSRRFCATNTSTMKRLEKWSSLLDRYTTLTNNSNNNLPPFLAITLTRAKWRLISDARHHHHGKLLILLTNNYRKLISNPRLHLFPHLTNMYPFLPL